MRSPILTVSSFLIALGISSTGLAQTGIAVAGFGYRTPANAIVAAPGQLLTVSIFGVAARIANPIFPTVQSGGFPTEVNGLSADFVQGPVTVQMQIRGVQQTPCPATGACSPATTFTIQMPYELDPGAASPAALRIKESGTAVATLDLTPATDSVHIINTCDQTGIFLSLAYDVPAGTCAPMVMHPRGPLVSQTSPAVPGETLVVWAYGLGAIDHPIPPDCCVIPNQVPVTVQPFNVNLSFADAGSYPLRRLAQIVPTWAGMVGGGLYQVHFVVPPIVPASGIPVGRPGHLNILVSCPASADSAQVYVLSN
jgi:uncharacterized protein (TIGR03437 family)